MTSENIKNSAKEIKFLMIGNSFSADAVKWLFEIGLSARVNLVIGNAFDNGQTLKGHYYKLQNDKSITAYDKWTSKSGHVRKPGAVLSEIINDEEWDIVTYQQQSAASGKYETYQPYLKEIHDYVSSQLRKDVRFGLHMTWAYAESSIQLTKSGYSNQMDMYTKAVGAYLLAMQEMNFDLLIPTGTAIQNARSNHYLKKIGMDLTHDETHLNKGIGRYIAALTVFETVFAGYYKKDLFSDVSFLPDIDNCTPFLGYLSKLVVKNACSNPFKITKIE